MLDLSKIKIRLVTEVEGRKSLEEEISTDEKFMADLIVAIRNGKSPADALAFLADIGSNHLNDPDYQISGVNRIGRR